MLADLLDSPPDDVARVRLRHVRRWRFRWMVLVEATVFLALVCCLVPALVVLALFGDADVDVPHLGDLSMRAWRYWHELELALLDPRGQVMATQTAVPDSGAHAEALARRREAEAVVARRRRDDPARALRRGHPQQRVRRAAQLERARVLDVLQLPADLRVEFV